MTPSLFWIDPRWQTQPSRPWRKVHLDFHNSRHIPRIGERFDPDEFGDCLQAAHVNAIVGFAKDMHGYFYYPTVFGPIHPGLSFDLLGMQVEACRKRNIKVYAYYCTTWDNYLAEQHPEWLVWKRDRTTYLPAFDHPPGWTALCLSNADFVQLVLDHTRETLERYDLDGIWYDMPLPIGGECFCRNCLAALREAGEDPFSIPAQRRHKQHLLVEFMRRAWIQAQTIRPGCQVDQNNQTRFGLGERAPLMNNIDIEALPTAFWGYLYFPIHVRYARTFGRSICGMSGRFHRSWGDFGGLKHPNQLRTELAAIIAHGAQCDLGDQLPPHGRLDPAVYQTIGTVYAEIERLEPFLDHAAPVTEAAILVRGNPLDELAQPLNTSSGQHAPGVGVYGLTKLLMECHVQFDIVEPDQEFERYRMIVLPDRLSVDEELAQRLRAYLSSGGAVIASHRSLLIDGTDRLWMNDLGLSCRGESPFAPAYMVLNDAAIWEGLPAYEYALYDGALRLAPHRSHTVLAYLGEPLFQRSAAHYTSHAQTPFERLTGDAVVARHDRMAALAFPIGTGYYRYGYWIYREVFRRLQRAILPDTLVSTDAPVSAEVTLTHQVAQGTRPERWMVHIINFSPVRRSPEHCEYLEDPIPLHHVRVALRVPGSITQAYTAAEGVRLPLCREHHGWEVTVPRVVHGEIVVFEVA